MVKNLICLGFLKFALLVSFVIVSAEFAQAQCESENALGNIMDSGCSGASSGSQPTYIPSGKKAAPARRVAAPAPSVQNPQGTQAKRTVCGATEHNVPGDYGVDSCEPNVQGQGNGPTQADLDAAAQADCYQYGHCPSAPTAPDAASAGGGNPGGGYVLQSSHPAGTCYPGSNDPMCNPSAAPAPAPAAAAATGGPKLVEDPSCATSMSAQYVNGKLMCDLGNGAAGNDSGTKFVPVNPSINDKNPDDTSGNGKYSNADANEPCNSQAAQTKSFCSAANAQSLVQQAATVAAMANASTANAGAACQMQSKIASMQELFSGGVAAACTQQIFACRDTCTPPPELIASSNNPENPNRANDKLKVNSYNANKSTCNGYSMQAAQAALNALAMGLTAKGAADCAKAYNAAAAATPPPVLAETCAGNPNYAATHALECYCATNPGDTKCLNPALAAAPGGIAVRLASGGALSKGLPGDQGSGTRGGFQMPTANPDTGKAAGGATGGGGGGFGGGGGGQNGAATAANAEDAPAAGAGNGGNVFGGFSAGQGGFSYGHAAGAAAAPGGIAGAVKALATKLNLNGLLPKRNDYVNRAVAGMSVSAQDGVTGPNGPSIWEKVSRRYQIKKGDLLPP